MQNFLSRKHAFFRLPLFKLRAYAEGVTDEDEYGSMLTVRECHRPALHINSCRSPPLRHL